MIEVIDKMTKSEFIDKLFDECEDEIDSCEIGPIIDFLKENNRDLNLEDFTDVFCRVFSTLLKPEELHKYVNEYGQYGYLLLASRMGVKDVIVGEGEVSIYQLNFSGRIDLNFNVITIKGEDIVSNLNCQECIVDTDKKVKLDLLDLKCKTLTINKDVDSITRVDCENIIFEDTVNNLPSYMQFNDKKKVSKIVLPPVDNIMIPRWMCQLNNDNLYIYRELGQKLGIFSVYKEWLKDHVKSI